MKATQQRPDNSPIYHDLIAELGDVLSQSRAAAKATEAVAARALDWSDLHLATESGSH